MHQWFVAKRLDICPQFVWSSVVGWTCPPRRWVKLHFDGSVILEAQVTSVGGRICIENGSLIVGFSGKINPTNPLYAELKALLAELQLCLSMNIHNVIIN